MEFVTLSTLPGIIGRYLMMLKVTDILDIAIMVFVFYKALTLIQSTRAASLDSRSYPYNVTSADRSSQCGTESLETVNIAIPAVSCEENQL